MARFLCAVHAPAGTPEAFALVEQADGGQAPTFTVRDLRALSGDDPTAALLDVLASEPQYAAHTTVVTTGGQRAANALHERGPSAVAVTLTGEGTSGDLDALDVSLQGLVDTFERLYRAGAVDVPGTLDAGSPAVDALYAGADLEAAAPGSDRDANGDLDAGPDDAPGPVVVEQSGSAASTSTEVLDTPEERLAVQAAQATAADARRARTVSEPGRPAPDLGEHAAVATALALAVWYGETSTVDLPATDQADAVLANRVNRPTRHN